MLVVVAEAHGDAEAREDGEDSGVLLEEREVDALTDAASLLEAADESVIEVVALKLMEGDAVVETDGVTLTLAVSVVQDDALDDATPETLLELDAADDALTLDSMLLVSLELALIAALADTIDAVAFAEMDTLLLTLKERLADAQLETESVGEEEASVDTEAAEDADVHAEETAESELSGEGVAQLEGVCEMLLEGDDDTDKVSFSESVGNVEGVGEDERVRLSEDLPLGVEERQLDSDGDKLLMIDRVSHAELEGEAPFVAV